jgi:hypothetical protein
VGLWTGSSWLRIGRGPHVLVPPVGLGDTTLATKAYSFHMLRIDGSSVSCP